jgi:hypothetical protein
LTNLVRFFENEEFIEKYTDIPIPQLQTYVWIYDKPYKVERIYYSFYECNANKENGIDVDVKEVSIESLIN